MGRCIVFAGLLSWIFVASALARGPIGRVDQLRQHPEVFLACGNAGQACCHAPAATQAANGPAPLVTCNEGLGCDLPSNTCVSPCGASGQACCDGPETRAPRWNANGQVYVPNAFNTREMCQSSVCEPNTRRCVAGCGMNAGEACCPPQPGIGVGTCINPALYCEFTDGSQFAQGTCETCGVQGKQACRGDPDCQDGLAADSNNICVFCGYPGQPRCGSGEPCRGGAVLEPRTHASCVAAGGPNQPCMEGGRCGYEGLTCNAANICEGCGAGGQVCCPGDHPCTDGLCTNDRCFSCGQEGLPVCPIGTPCPRAGEPVGGYCRACGGEGQACCRSFSVLCNEGLHCDDSTCRGSSGGGQPPNDPRTCSGQPYTLSTIARTVFVDYDDGCLRLPHPTYLASTPAEAEQCARLVFGENVIGSDIESFDVSLSCPFSGCITRQYPARDFESAKRCAAAQEGPESCEVIDGACP